MPTLASGSFICVRCGRKYGTLRGNFPVCYGALYKGIGFLPYCKDCIDVMFNTYLNESKDVKKAVRQMCRKLDLYWSEAVFEGAHKQTTVRNLIQGYMTRLIGNKLSGKSYDDTLNEEGILWEFNPAEAPKKEVEASPEEDDELDNMENKVIAITDEEITAADISKEIVEYWGYGQEPIMYLELEQRKSYWTSKSPFDGDIDIGTEALLKQICALEIDINRTRASGGSPDRSIANLNSLLGSANLKPTQKKSDDQDSALEKTPMGVWIQRWENDEPLPEPDPEFKDRDGVVRYIDTWFRGHMAKMLNIKNSFSKLYEDKINELRIDRPEYEDDDDEALFNDVFEDVYDEDDVNGGDDYEERQ